MRVLTMGTFDLLHPGHLALFRWCRRLAGEGGTVVATVNSDAFVERYKGRPPVMGERERLAMVLALPDVDECVVHRDRKFEGQEDVPAEQAWVTIQNAKPDIIAIGADWRDRDYLGQLGVTQEWLDERGIVVVYVPLLAGHSSTALREGLGMSDFGGRRG